MTYDAHANLASGLVTVAPVTPTGGLTLTATPDSGVALPATPFSAVVAPVGLLPTHANAEILRVTGVAGQVWTIARAQEGTSARSVLVGDAVYVGGVTAKTLTDIESAVTAETSRATTAEGLLAKGLIPVALKTVGYAPSVNEFVPVDASSAGVTVTLPTAPADKTRIGVKKIDSSTNLVTITRGGTDVFNKVGGSTSVSLTYANQGVQIQYESATGIWYAVASDIGLTALDTRYDATGLATAAAKTATRTLMLPVGSGAQVTSSTFAASGSFYGTNMRKRHLSPVAASGVRVTHSNFYNNSGQEADATIGPVTVSCAIEDLSGNRIQVTWNGQTTVTIQPGKSVTSDFVACLIGANTAFYSRTHMEVSSLSVAFPILGPAVTGNGEAAISEVLQNQDKTMIGTIAGAGYGLPPTRVEVSGLSTALAVEIIGDSIVTGAGNASDVYTSYADMALAGTTFYQKASIASNRAMYESLVTGRWRRWPLLTSCNVTLFALGINDLSGGQTLAQFQASAISVWASRATIGRKVWAATLLPQTTSTDAWATTANQTVRSWEASRTGYNDWLRDGAPVTSTTNLTAVAVGTGGALRAGTAGHPLTGYLELADLVEANAAGALTRNGGRWRVDLGAPTTDGTHPVQTLHTTLSAGVTSILATWSAAISSPTQVSAIEIISATDPRLSDLRSVVDSATLGGVPAAATAAVDTNTTQLATTAFVLAQAAAAVPLLSTSNGAVGTSTRFARADHTHPRYDFEPDDHSMLAWAYDPVIAGATSVLATAGTIYVVRVKVPVAVAVTNVVTQVPTVGSGLTANQCFAAVYQAGVLIGVTADQSVAWTSTGIKTMALAGGPKALAAGDAYIAYLFNGTTGPTLLRNSAQSLINVGTSAAASRFGTANTAQTSMPGTLGAITSSVFSLWGALS